MAGAAVGTKAEGNDLGATARQTSRLPLQFLEPRLHGLRRERQIADQPAESFGADPIRVRRYDDPDGGSVTDRELRGVADGASDRNRPSDATRVRRLA